MSAPDAPEAIGPYTLTEVLGEGGMGVVYLAEQSEPVRRTVALKLLRTDQPSKEVLSRFQAERQALAVMDHPSIAKIFDAGVTEDDRPYFVMERVDGRPLNVYCDEERLTVRERVRLFTVVCQAVQHAHQKGLIHRDLKPSNVLVSQVDGRPVPRVIDFGIAKAVEAEEFDGTRLTRVDEVVGTPAYMSPEQIDSSTDIDTRSDVYSLGVLLYELLVGVLPYEDSAYRGWAGIMAALHRDPPTVGRRFEGLSGDKQALAEARSTSVPRLGRALAGDLEHIVSRAMERERDLRYETANGLAVDLERFLADEPVRARGPGAAYALKKFVRRNRMGVAFAATVAAGLVGFSLVTAIQAGRIAQARDEAQARRGQAEDLIDFMLSDLRDKLEPMGRLEILDDVGSQALRYFASIPEYQLSDEELMSRSRALYQIGSVRLEQGDSEAAVGAFTESLRLARALSERAPQDPERLFGLSQSYFYVGYASWLKGDLADAEDQFLGYLAAAERLVELDPGSLDYRLELGFAHSNLGTVREARGDLEGAAAAYERTLEAKEALVEQDFMNVEWIGELAETHNKLGVLSRKRGDYAGALGQHRRELVLKQIIRERDPDHAYWRYRFAFALAYLADVQKATGHVDEALELRHRQVALLDSLVRHDPTNKDWKRDLAVSKRAAAEALMGLGRLPEAIRRLGEARGQLAELVAMDSTGFGWRFDLGAVHTLQAELALARRQPGEALAQATTATSLMDGEPSSSVGRAMKVASALLVRGSALDALRRPEEARRHRAGAMSALEPFLRGPDRTELRPLLVKTLLALGRKEEAQEEFALLQASGYADPTLASSIRKQICTGGNDSQLCESPSEPAREGSALPSS